MALRIGVLAHYQNLLSFLWLEDTTSDVVVHQYTRHVIGSRYSVKKRSSVKTLNCAKDTQIQLERALGKAHDYPHNPRKRSDRELCLPHHPVVNPNKPGNVRPSPLWDF